MGLLGKRDVVSPQQVHRVHMANDVLWLTGEMETLGNPHNYINQDGLNFIRVSNSHVTPWAFTGLPASHAPLMIMTRERTQLIVFPDPASMEQFRPPMRTDTLIINLSLVVVRGKVPFLSEAQVHNFLDFWKGIFFPVMDASLYFLTDGPADLPTESPLVYINRNLIQSYLSG
ncbi:MAG TPA: hypothetical protein PKH77_12555 [Anaerolineae bacterium]|nr:hypothetical protein [Anaerolineae bacterium]